MAGVALVLLVERESESYSVAGLAAALFAGGAAAGGVVYARLIARFGFRSPLFAGGLACGAGFGAIPVAVDSGRVLGYLTCIALTGLTFPPLAACVRSQWNRAYRDPERLMRAATLESVVGEIAFLLGPALVTLSVTAWSEALPFPIAGTMIAVASIGFARYAVEPPEDEPTAAGARSSLWRVAFVLTLMAGTLWCVSFGALTVGIVAASAEADRRDVSGLLVAVVSAGAIAGGLGFGAWARGVDPGRLLVPVLAGYAACLAPLAVVHHVVPAFVLVLALVGTTSAIVLACLYLRIVEGVAAVLEVEAYSWLNGFTVAGLAIGPAIGGQLADRAGSEGPFAAASALAATAAVLALRARSR